MKKMLPPAASTTSLQSLQITYQNTQAKEQGTSQTIVNKQLTATPYDNRTFDWAALAEYNGGSGAYLTELGGAGHPEENADNNEDTRRRHEEMMKKADTKVYKQRLLDLRARLQGDVTSLAEAALGEGTEASSMPIHMAELGSENFEQEFTLSLMASEEGTLESIELSLQRIEEGTFGQCLACEGAIPKTRLNALPYAPMCVKCASSRDQNRAG